MQEEHGMAGVRFWMLWLALVVCGLIVRQHPIGLAIVGVLTALWAGFAIHFLIGRFRAGATMATLGGDADLVLAIVSLSLTGLCAMVLIVRTLHLTSVEVLLLVIALSSFSAGWRSWSRRAGRRLR